MPAAPESIKAKVTARTDEHGRCIECNQKVTIYSHRMDDLNVVALRKIWEYVVTGKENKIDVGKAGLNYEERSRVTQLRFHGLIAKYKTATGTQVPSTWLMTKRGGDFLKGIITIPAIVYTFDNEVIGHGIEQVGRKYFRTLNDFGAHYEAWDIVDGKMVETPRTPPPAVPSQRVETYPPDISICCDVKIVDNRCTKCGRIAWGKPLH